MTDDDHFLRTIHAKPEDTFSRLVYADWLEERGDPRGEFLRLEGALATMALDDERALQTRRRLIELRPLLQLDWLIRVGSFHWRRADPKPRRVEAAAQTLGRPVEFVDEDGFTRQIVAAVENPRTRALAYVESRLRQQGKSVDVKYHLRLRDTSGREESRQIETYDPYYGCDVRFLEWFGDTVLMIYREKHKTYVCRFGVRFQSVFLGIKEDWLLDGPFLAYWNAGDPVVRRLAIPSLKELRALPLEEAKRWGLLGTRADLISS